MSGPDDIDALVVARRVLANPKTFRVSTHEELALAGCLVALDGELDAIENHQAVRASLAAAIAKFIQKEEAMAAAKGPDGYVPLPVIAARYEAFNTLKTTFETEFPHV
jgi:hypothetical protein